MEHSEFHIGLEFWCSDKKWRCTDVGTRVIVAISLEPHEVVTIYGLDPSIAGPCNETRHITDHPSWLNGPPYAVAESVFDEYDLGGCSIEREEPVEVMATP
jgi:hypothetical protein